MSWSPQNLPLRATISILVIFLLPLANSAPLTESSTEIEYYPVADATGCYYNFQHYDEGDRIITNEPCLNCTCHNRMLMCYLRVCPFTKAIGQDCTVEKRADQCCPVITCPEVPVSLMPSSTPGSTEVGHPDTYGCSIDSLFYSDGARVPSHPNNPCELCYCIRNKTACVMQECTLKIEGCKPVYQEGVCCPVRYDCDHSNDNLLEGPTSTSTTTTTTTTSTTPGLIFTTTLAPGKSTDCIYNNDLYADGALINHVKPCENCYCMKGDIVCAVQECAPTPLEKINCTALPVREGQCCPDAYECENMTDEDLTTLSYNEVTTLPSIVPEDTKAPSEEPLATTPEATGQTIPSLVDRDQFTESPASGVKSEEPKQTTTISDVLIPITTVTPDAMTQKSEEQITTVLPDNNETKSPIIDLIPESQTEERAPEVTTQTVINQEPLSEKTSTTYNSELSSTEPSHTPVEELYTTEHTAPKQTTTQEEIRETTEKDYQVTVVPQVETTSNEFTQITTEKEMEYVTMLPETENKHIASAEHVTEPKPLETTFENIKPSETPEETHDKEDLGGLHDDDEDDQEHEQPKLPVDETQEKETEPSMSTEHVPQLETIESGLSFPEKSDKSPESITEYKKEPEEVTESSPQTTQSLNAEDDNQKPSLSLTDKDLTGSTVVSVEEENVEPTEKLEKEKEPAILQTTVALEDVTTPSAISEKSTESQQALEPTHEQITEEPAEPSHEPEGEHDDHEEEDITTEAQHPEVVSSESAATTLASETAATTVASETAATTVASETAAITVASESGIEITESNKISEESLVDKTTTSTKEESIVTTEYSIASSSESEQKQDTATYTEKEPEQTTLLHEEVTEGIKEPSSTESLSTREPNLEEQTTDKQHQEVPFDTKSETTTLGNIFENEVTTSLIQEVTETESSIPQRPYGIPGEGSCLVDGQTYQNNSEVPTINHCQTSCKCISSILQCQAVDCTPPPRDSQNCYPVYAGPESCCPTFNCSAASADKNMEIDNGVVDSECISTECKLVGSQPDQVEGSTETSPITDKPGIQSEDKQATESPEEQSGVVTTIISDRMPEEDTSTSEAVKPETSNIKLTPEKEETTTVSNKEQQTEKTGEHDLQQITESAPVDITTSIQEQTTNKVAIEEHVTTEKVIGEFTEASATVQPDVNLPTSEKITTEKETQTSRIPGEDIHHDNEDLFEPESGDTETTQDTTETKVSQETTTLRDNLADVSTNKPIEESIATQPQQNVPESVTDRIAESQTTISSDEKVTTLKPLVESEAETTDAHEFTSENKLSEENPTTSYEIVHPETTVASQEVTTEKSQKDIVQPESRPEEIITDNAITDKITTEKVPEIEAPEILTQSPEVTLVEQRPESMDHKQSTEEITTVKPEDETIKSLSSSEQPETTTKPATVSSEQPTSLPEQTVSSEMPTSRPQQAVAVTQEPEHQPESAGVTESSEAKKPIPEITTVVSEQQTEVPDKVTSATEPAVIVSEFITTKEPHVETDKPIGVTQSTDAAELPVAETEVPAIVTEQSIVLTEPSVESTKQPAFESEKPSTENEIPIAATGKPSDVTEQKPIATDAPSIEPEHSEITTISSIPVTEQTFSTEQSVVKGEHPEIINEPLDISTEQSAWSEAETTEQDGKATEQPPIVTEQPQIILEVATTVDPETTSASAEQSEAVTRAEELTTMSLSDPLSHKTELPIELTTAESPEKSSSELNEPSAVNPTTTAPEETTMKASSKTPFNEADLTTTISSVAELSTEKEALEPTKEVNTISPELEKETEPENEVTSIPSVSTSETTESEIEVTTPIEHEKESIPEKTQAGDENLKATETTEPWADVTTDASAGSIGEGIKGQETEKPIKSETTTSSENYERTTVGAETENPIKPEEPVNQTELATSNQEPGKEYTTLAPDTTEKLTEVAVTDAPKESEVTTSKQEAAFTSPSLTTKDTNEHPAPSTESTGGLFTSPPEIISTTGNKYVVGELSTSATSSTTAAAAVETTTVAAVETTIGAINEIHDHDEHQPEMPDYQAPGEDYEEEDHNTFGPGTCRYGGKVYVSAQQIPRDDPCDFCFCFRSDIICLQQSCPPPIPRCHEEPIRGFCCPRYECPVNMATSLNVTTTTTTTTTTLPPHFLSHAYKGRATKTGCLIRGQAYKVGDHIPSASGPCLNCTCGGNGQMKCDPKACSPEPMLRQMMEAAISRRRR